MSYTLYSRLISITGGVVCHRLQETADRFLVEWGNASVLLNYLSFHSTHAFAQRSLPGQHISNVHAQPSYSRQIGGIRVSSAPLVAALGVAVHSAHLGQIFLI